MLKMSEADAARGTVSKVREDLTEKSAGKMRLFLRVFMLISG
jgi:hypothetical protein